MATSSALFQSKKVGNCELKHRVVLAPLTRLRCDENRVPNALVQEYYEQRTTEGGLIIAEATGVSPSAGIYPGGPGIYNNAHCEGWKKITKAVHDKGGFIFSQLWHAGRATCSSFMPGGALPLAPSAVAIEGPCLFSGKNYGVPHALTVEEIGQVVEEFAQAAKYAVDSGFDGVEIHAANGYVVDQFINTSSNKRTDEYGGSIENRSRFCLEVTKAVVDRVGEDRVAVRLSPWSEFQDMEDATPYETWGYIVDELQQRHPHLAYIHMIEPRDDYGRKTKNDTVNTLDPFRAKWKGPFISAGGYTTHPALATEIADATGNLIAIGRAFLANPDLPHRLEHGLPLNKYDRSTFYTNTAGSFGYTDYPYYQETKA
ncbi:hypothetical protein BJV82DRAFT_669483 [Fennellomyces sp. T-0311]|nr:hypothetical protein BJV82DRAFT_669483 [Fennellomyces sp. T-0311]